MTEYLITITIKWLLDDVLVAIDWIGRIFKYKFSNKNQFN